MERNLHGKNYTNGLNIKVCLVVDSFSRNLKKQFLIIKIDMSKILIIEDEAAIRRVLSKYSEESDTYQVEDAEDGVQLKNKK
jgi:dimeric dUTPase (all-alpha-NTP-PPase superfamily)